jgi:hypothetical protein
MSQKVISIDAIIKARAKLLEKAMRADALRWARWKAIHN